MEQIVIYLLIVQKFGKLNQKILRLQQLYYVLETFQRIGLKIICSGSYNNIKDPYAKTCVPDVIKNLNIKVFNLMSRVNETKHIK